VLQLTIPSNSKVLFETVLEPAAPAVDKLRKDVGAGEGEINVFRGKKNKLTVGLYDSRNLIARMQEQNLEMSYEINKMKNEYDFHYAVLTCSFLPDNDCRFEWARFGVQLSAKQKSGEPSTIKPVAHYLFPTEINAEIKYKKEVSVTPELKLSLFEIVDAGIAGGVTQSMEYVIYEPQVTSSGISKSTVAWDFKKTKEKGILGDKIVLLVVRGPKDSRVKGRFLLGAEVSSKLSKWVPIPLSKRKDKAVDAEYDLSE
jgi:hypothetical protein